jgi:hypothetical protein
MEYFLDTEDGDAEDGDIEDGDSGRWLFCWVVSLSGINGQR